MARRQSLAEQLRERKRKRSGPLVRGADGQLTQLSDTGIQQITTAQGVDAPPTSPAAAVALGASPDSAKMVGDARQKAAALDIAARGGRETLATHMRTRGLRREATGTEAESMARAKSPTLQKLGSLGDRVHNVLQSQIATTAEGGAQLGEGAIRLSEAGQQLTPEQQQAVTTAISNPTDMQARVGVANALGLTIDELDADTLNQYWESGGAGEQVAGQLADSIEMGQLITELGFPEEDEEARAELSELLGVESLDEIGSVEQLQEAVRKAEEEEFSRVEELRELATSPDLSPAERAEVRQQLRDLGAVGVRATEEEVEELGAKVQEGNIVEFAGKETSVADLLSDENISGLVSEYLGADDATKEEMRKKEPSFFSFVDENEAALEDAADEQETGTTNFVEIQEANQQLAEVPEDVATPDGGGKVLDDTIMSQLFPDWDQFRAGTYAGEDGKTGVALIDELQSESRGPKEKAALLQNLRAVKDFDPEMAAEFRNLSSDDLESLGMYSGNSEQLTNYITFRKKQRKLEEADPNDLDQILSIAFDGDGDQIAQIGDHLESGWIAKQLGLGNSGPLSVLDSDGDGKVDSPDRVRESLLGMNSGVDLAGIAGGKSLSAIPTQTQVGKLSRLIGTAGRHERKTLAGILRDGQITEGEANRLSLDTMERLAQGTASKGLARQFRREYRSRVNRVTEDWLGNLPSTRNPARLESESALREEIRLLAERRDSPHANRNRLQEVLRQRERQLAAVRSGNSKRLGEFRNDWDSVKRRPLDHADRTEMARRLYHTDRRAYEATLTSAERKYYARKLGLGTAATQN